jgi:ribosomal protein S18 acetylase RimI-like enzyme
MRYAVREATVDDAALIAEFRRAMFAEMGYTPYIEAPGMDAAYTRWASQRLTDQTMMSWLMMTDAGEIIGSAGVEISEGAPHPVDLSTRRGLIVNVYIAPKHRRQGLARRLLHIALDWCAAQHIRVITLHASDQGRPLYESLGFEITNEMRYIAEGKS